MLQREIFKFIGVNADVEPVELMNGPPAHRGAPIPNVWTDARNVHVNDDSTVRVNGYASFADPLPAGAVPIFTLNVLTPTESYWLWVDGQTPGAPLIYVTDGANHFNITPTVKPTGGGAGYWTGTVLNGVPVLNNGVDVPVWWNGNTGSVMAPLPGWPATTRARSVRAYKYHLVALNLTEDSVVIQDKYMWSAAADPGTIPQTWTPEPGNDAGFNTLSSTPGGIVDGEILRDEFIIYKNHSCYLMSYIAGQYVFSVRKLFVTSGALSLNCIVELRGYHYVLSDGDLVRHDGNTYESVADKRVRKFIFDNIDSGRLELAHLAVNKSLEDVWVNFPTLDSVACDAAVLYSYVDDAFGMRRLPGAYYVEPGIIPDTAYNPTWDGSPTNWDADPRTWNQTTYSAANDQLLMSGPTKLYHVDAALDNDGEPVEAFVERVKWTIFNEDHVWRNDLISAIYPIITGQKGDVIKVQVAGTNDPNDAPAWVSRDYVIGDSDTKVDILSTGRFLNIRFSSVGGAPWEVNRIGVEFTPRGRW